MKEDPLNILLNNNFIFNKKFYYISGNEVSLIEKVYNLIINWYLKEEGIYKTQLDTVDDFSNESGLFGNRRLFVARNCKGIKNESLKKLRNGKDIFIFIQENSAKTKKIKDLFLKDKESCVVDCYELDKAAKIKVLNEFLKVKELKITDDIYWFLIDRLDNRYTFIENSLNNILEIDIKNINLENIKKLVSPEETVSKNFFLHLFKKNNEIVEMYKERIVSNSDVNELYYNCKYFFQLIIDCKNEEDYKSKIPIYLFKEKKYLIEVYRKYNFNKRKKILNLFFNMEKILRKENNLSLAYGLRFILNVKKITIS